MAPGERFTIHYYHSVENAPIWEEHSLDAEGRIYIEEERYLKYGAGMGKMPGVGRMVRRGPYEVIEDMHMPTGDFILRVGSPGVDHTVIWRGGAEPFRHGPPCGSAIFRPTGEPALPPVAPCLPSPRHPCLREQLMSEKPMPDNQSTEKKVGPQGRNQTLVTATARVVLVLAVALSLYQLYTAGIAALTALVQRSIHLGAILSLTFLLKPAFNGARKDRLNLWVVLDWILVLASIYCTYYICSNLNAIFERQGDWLTADLVVSIIGSLLVMEACRRVIGLVMTGICVIAVLYAYFGPYMPELIIHKGYSLERIATTLWLTTEGIFGLPLGVAATFVFVFVLFGAILEATGGGNFFINLAYSLTGRFSGGPAKTAVVASGFMGSVSGSAVGNVVATGSFTIPMMKKVGYRPHVAGAIEAAASTGGQLMPPIMGAGAFLMAEFTNTSYLTIIKVALVPAIMYYITVLFFVHFEARKEGLRGQPRENLPPILDTLREGLHFIIPVGILIYVLVSNYSPMMAGFVAVMSTLAASLAADSVRWTVGRSRQSAGQAPSESLAAFSWRELKMIISALEKGAVNAIMVSVACAAAGIIVGMVTLTGMGLKFSSLVLDLSFGIKALAILLIGAASLVLGHGAAGYRQLHRAGHPGGPGTAGHGGSPAGGAYDRVLVFPGCQRHSASEPGKFCRRRRGRSQSHAHRLYILETGQGALYYPADYGLPAAFGHRRGLPAAQLAGGLYHDHHHPGPGGLCFRAGALFSAAGHMD